MPPRLAAKKRLTSCRHLPAIRLLSFPLSVHPDLFCAPPTCRINGRQLAVANAAVFIRASSRWPHEPLVSVDRYAIGRGAA
jgi:hypothetical protein